MFQGSTSLKYYKRLGIYKNSTGTVSFDPKSQVAWSYNWKFLAPVNGALVFNNYSWSNTSNGHQVAVRSVLRELKLNIIMGDFGRRGVDVINIESVYKSVAEAELYLELRRKGSGAEAGAKFNLKYKTDAFNALKSIGFKLSVKRQKEIRAEVFDKHLEELNFHEFYKACKHMDTILAKTDLTDPEF